MPPACGGRLGDRVISSATSISADLNGAKRWFLPLLACALLAGTMFLTGCATKPTDPDDLDAYNEAHDPAEPTNRVIYKINDKLDVYALAPVARAYRYIAPQHLVREPIHRILLNAQSPVLFGNDVLQAKPRRAAATFVRFVVNSTLGLGGIFDVAAKTGLPAHDTDFGETLAVWGVPDGPFVELPLYGPSNPRDAIGKGVDFAMDPLTWIGSGAAYTDMDYGRFGMTAVDERERALDGLAAIKKTSLDPYATIRSLYRQNRDSSIEALRGNDTP